MLSTWIIRFLNAQIAQQLATPHVACTRPLPGVMGDMSWYGPISSRVASHTTSNDLKQDRQHFLND
jgi:hypothetical protein